MGRIARSIVEGHGFSSPFFDPSGPTAMLPPAYPYLVALCMKLFGGFTVPSAMAVLTFNSLFASLTVIPVYFLAKRALDERTALLAGWTWAFFPYSIYLGQRANLLRRVDLPDREFAVAANAALGEEPHTCRLAGLGSSVGERPDW